MNQGAGNSLFECPHGFSKEEIQAQMYYEDVDDDSELWLVRVPNGMDPNVIENQMITFSSQSHALTGNDGKYYEYVVDKSPMKNLSLVLPHKESKNLQEIKKTFNGSILVTERIMADTNMVKMEVEENRMKEEIYTSEVLHQDGVDSPVKKKSKSRKSSKGNKASGSELNLSTLSDLCLEDNDQPSSSPKKKKHRKKKSKDFDSFKVEPLSDGDEFPNCNSQKK